MLDFVGGVSVPDFGVCHALDVTLWRATRMLDFVGGVSVPDFGVCHALDVTLDFVRL